MKIKLRDTGDDAIKKGVSKSIVLFISMICHLD